MADGVTTLGGGWDQAPAGSAEALLGALIAEGRLTGEQIVDALKLAGFTDRGPAYYPREVVNGQSRGPFYALGNPHDYAAIDGGRWDLIGMDPSTVPVRPVPPPVPLAPPPPVSPPAPAVTHADLNEAVVDICAHVDVEIEKVHQQIESVVRNAEASSRALIEALSPIFPQLANIFPKRGA